MRTPSKHQPHNKTVYEYYGIWTNVGCNSTVTGMTREPFNTITNNFPTIIRELRCSKGLTQEELAERANLHFTYISQIERGLKSPSLRTLTQIANALEIKLYTIIEKIEN